MLHDTISMVPFVLGRWEVIPAQKITTDTSIAFICGDSWQSLDVVFTLYIHTIHTWAGRYSAGGIIAGKIKCMTFSHASLLSPRNSPIIAELGSVSFIFLDTNSFCKVNDCRRIFLNINEVDAALVKPMFCEHIEICSWSQLKIAQFDDKRDTKQIKLTHGWWRKLVPEDVVWKI